MMRRGARAGWIAAATVAVLLGAAAWRRSIPFDPAQPCPSCGGTVTEIRYGLIRDDNYLHSQALPNGQSYSKCERSGDVYFSGG